MEKSQEVTQSKDSQALSVITEKGLISETTRENSERAVAAVATKARAEIEAGYIMARKFPRNEDNARVKVLKTCANIKFAESAKYKKPIGNTAIIGPSIRLAEEMARQWGNIRLETSVLYEDKERRIIQVVAIDLESGLTSNVQAIIEKTVERKNAAGRTVISERINSFKEKISIVEATEDEVLTKANALSSKLRRNLILQLIPTYLLQDALAEVDRVVKLGIKDNPDKARHEVADNFAKLNIFPSDIEQYLGHPLPQVTADELVDLKQIFSAIRDGETTWPEVLATKDIKEAVAKKEPEKASFKAGDPSTHTSVKESVCVPRLSELKNLCSAKKYTAVDLGYESFDLIPADQVEKLIKDMTGAIKK